MTTQGKIVSADNKISVEFVVTGEEVTDQAEASYQPLATSTLGKRLLQAIYGATGLSEMATRYQGITPKNLSFSISWYASHNTGGNYSSGLTASDIRNNIQKLQSFCYPERLLGGNPSVARLVIAELYNFDVLITSVQVTWLGLWTLDNMPMNSQVQITCEQFSYPIAADVIAGLGFKTSTIKPYQGRVEE